MFCVYVKSVIILKGITSLTIELEYIVLYRILDKYVKMLILYKGCKKSCSVESRAGVQVALERGNTFRICKCVFLSLN